MLSRKSVCGTDCVTKGKFSVTVIHGMYATTEKLRRGNVARWNNNILSNIY